MKLFYKFAELTMIYNHGEKDNIIGVTVLSE